MTRWNKILATALACTLLLAGAAEVHGEKKGSDVQSVEAEQTSRATISIDGAKRGEDGLFRVEGETAVVRMELSEIQEGIRAIRWSAEESGSVCTMFRAATAWQEGDVLDGWEVTGTSDGSVTGLCRVMRIDAKAEIRTVTMEADDRSGETRAAESLRFCRSSAAQETSGGPESGGGGAEGEGGSGSSGSGDGGGGGAEGTGGSGSSGSGDGGGGGSQGGTENGGSSAEGTGGSGSSGSGDDGGGGAEGTGGPGSSGSGESGGSGAEGTGGSGSSGSGDGGGGGSQDGPESGGGGSQGRTESGGIDEVQVRGVDQETMYTGTVRGEIRVRDAELQTSTVRLWKVTADGRTEEVTEQFLRETDREEGGASVQLHIPQAGHTNDGIYRLEIEARDATGNVRREQRIFTVNTAGSLFAYSAELEALRGCFVQGVSDPIRITEYNPGPIRTGSTRVEVLLDGAQIDIGAIRRTEEGGADGWNRCTYEIPASCFLQEGVYQVNVICLDAAGHPAESALTQGPVIFTVDRTPPQIRTARVRKKDGERVLEFELFDAAGLASYTLSVGKNASAAGVIADTADLAGEVRHRGKCVLPGDEPKEGYEISVRDRAGNETKEQVGAGGTAGGIALRRAAEGLSGRWTALLIAVCTALFFSVFRVIRRIDK